MFCDLAKLEIDELIKVLERNSEIRGARELSREPFGTDSARDAREVRRSISGKEASAASSRGVCTCGCSCTPCKQWRGNGETYVSVTYLRGGGERKTEREERSGDEEA